MRARRAALTAVVALWLCAGAAAAGEGPLFEPPTPGSYALPPIERVAPHELLGPDGAPVALPGIAPDEVALVSFIYTSCHDACPLALATLQRLDRALAERPALSARTRLVSVSFDPERDTPERMAELREYLAPKGRWDFLTAADRRALTPVLVEYGQDVRPPATRAEMASGRLRHVLKVFLVDGRGDVRNIYSIGFLDPRILLADVETVLQETSP